MATAEILGGKSEHCAVMHKGGRMKLRVITMDGLVDEVYEVTFFEFRSNQLANWIKLWLTNGEKVLIQKVAVIKYEVEK